VIAMTAIEPVAVEPADGVRAWPARCSAVARATDKPITATRLAFSAAHLPSHADALNLRRGPSKAGGIGHARKIVAGFKRNRRTASAISSRCGPERLLGQPGVGVQRHEGCDPLSAPGLIVLDLLA
jgi:hypothetical protein